MVNKHTFDIQLYNIQLFNIRFYEKFSCLRWLPVFMLSIGAFAQDNSQNWVKTIAYKTDTTTPIVAPTAAQAKVNVTYLDGMGRPIMQIANMQSNSGKDIVQPIVYDQFGRTPKQYLPYVSSTSTMALDANAASNVAASYPEFPNQNLYTETLFEASPLNRILKQAAPGDLNSWAMGSGHEVKYKYTTNAIGDVVKKYSVNSSGGLVDNGFYVINELYKSIVYNENSIATPDSDTENATISFTNNKGQVVLTRTYAIDSGFGATAMHDTYTVYDFYENVAIVIPPLTSAAIASGTTTAVAQDETYQYKYDNYNRLIEKKEPNKNWQFIVYDRLNRIVATGPSVTPFGGLETETGWMVSFYDNLNRPCYSGWYPQANINSASRNTLQTTFDGAIANVTKTTSGTIDGLSVFYSGASLPTGFKLLSVNYYDTYNYPNAPTSFLAVEGQIVAYNTTVLPKGLPTGSWVRTLTAATNAIVGETSYILYDYRARPILARNNNYLGGYTQVKTKVDFSSKTNYTKTEHQRTNVVTTLITTVNNFTYSDQDRLLTQTKQVNNNPAQLLSANKYNERGQLLTKMVGDEDITGATALQKVDYTYNIRGWLKGINDVNASINVVQTGAKPDLFAFGLNYQDNNKTVTYPAENLVKPLFNGNISESFWRTSSDNVLRKYGYEYDNLNRLNSAVYQKVNLSSNSNAYGESMNYDKNGNIINLLRYGDFDTTIAGQAIKIDELNYYYYPNTNKLKSVNDLSNSTLGFKNNAIATTADVDYTYDLNGNIKTDNNKGITSIKYNHLNLPVEINFSATKKISYIYTASGEKVLKKVTNGTAVTTTDYISGYQYSNAVLKFFPTSEGYVNFDVGVYKYVFNYLDHLGNIRLSYTKDVNGINGIAVIEENHYYPYGLKHTNYNVDVLRLRGATTAPTNSAVNKYKFNGQEYQDELSLNLYDMDMRDYDPAIARWTGIDPVVHYSQSTYNAFDGNPVFWADPSGADGTRGDGNGGTLYTGINGVSYNPNGGGGGMRNLNMTNGVRWNSHWGDGPAGSTWYHYDGLTVKLDWGNLDTITNINFSKNSINLSSTNDIIELLPEIKVYASKGGGRFNDDVGNQIQSHVYNNGVNYQFYRTQQNIAKAYAVAQGMQDIGDGAMVLGTMSVLTGYGAIAGAGMVQYGGYLSMAGTGVELLTDFYAGKWSNSKLLTKVAMEAIPFGAKFPFEKLGAPNAAELVNVYIIGFDRMLDEFRDIEVGPYR